MPAQTTATADMLQRVSLRRPNFVIVQNAKHDAIIPTAMPTMRKLIAIVE